MSEPVNRVALLLSQRQAMPKHPIRKSQLGTYIPEDLHDSIREYSDATGIPIARIVEDALRAYLRNNYWPEEEEV